MKFLAKSLSKLTALSKYFFLDKVLLLLLVLGVVYLAKGLFVTAIVNGEPIYRSSVIKTLEKSQGKEVVDSLVTKILVLQEARKQKIVVDQNEIDAKIKEISDNLNKQGQNLDQVLALQGQTKKDLAENIRLQRTIEKLLEKDTVIKDEEVEAFLKDNKDLFDQSKKPEEIKLEAKNELKNQKLREKFTSWLDSVKQKAKILYFVKY